VPIIKGTENNDLMLQLKHLEKQEQANPKPSRTREIITMRAKINEKRDQKKNTKNHGNKKADSLKK
jgi:hypothetical protein